MDRETRGITQPRCGVQLLQNGGCRPSYFLRPGEGGKNFGCLQKEMIAYSDDFKTAVVEFACDKVDLRPWAVKENRPARLGAISRSRNRHVSLYALAGFRRSQTSGQDWQSGANRGQRVPQSEAGLADVRNHRRKGNRSKNIFWLHPREPNDAVPRRLGPRIFFGFSRRHKKSLAPCNRCRRRRLIESSQELSFDRGDDGAGEP